MEHFIESVNEHIDVYTPEGAYRYRQSRSAVIYYLNLYKPNENYIFKATEANDWANCAEFGEDIGSGALFSLAKYYRMCDELLKVINSNFELLKLNSDRVKERGITEFDDKNHILICDIMYCAYHYLFYDKACRGEA